MKPITAFAITLALVVLVGGTIAAVVPGWAGVAIGTSALWVFAAGLLLFARLMRQAPGRGHWFDRMLRTSPSRPGRPADLEHLERVLGWRAYSGPDFDHQVRPVLGALVRHRLRDRHGIDVTTDRVRATDVAGADLVALTISHRMEHPTTTTMRTPDIQLLVERIAAL